MVLINWLIDSADLAVLYSFKYVNLHFKCFVTYVCQPQLQLFLLARITVHLN